MIPSGSYLQTRSHYAGTSMFTYIAFGKEIIVPQMFSE
jgi:hypothetical protein